MIFEFDSSGKFSLMEKLAKASGKKIKDGILLLPESFAKGYIKRIPLGPFMDIMIHEYELAIDVTGKRPAAKTGGEFITFSFRNVLLQQNNDNSIQQLPSVQISSGDIHLDMSFSAGTKINTIILNVHIDLLKDLLNKKDENNLLQSIISGTQPYFYEELISPAIQEVAAKIVTANASNELLDFYYKLRAEELIYLFFVELLKRKNITSNSINITDVKKIYAVRDKIIADLTKPILVTELAQFAGMSESKMNRLFKQIFGNSIYNYHQKLRINQAAYLIKNERLSVSEAGYQLGFTNLSHFTRIFERSIGIKPKRYSRL
jgi:AraC-like DNA-binding protein